MGTSGGYYGNSLKLLSMLVISGNYWVPDCDLMNGIIENKTKNKLIHINLQNQTKQLEVYLNQNTQYNMNCHFYNIFGQEINQTKLSSNKEMIDISQWPSGTYILSLQNDKTILQTEKILIP